MQAATNTMVAPETGKDVLQKKILLLEDDSALQDVIREFLEENNYKVVAVRNGVDGVREIMASDFEIIICDMMMPSLPGDMFYLAVERMRPHLCDRFIFITGLRDNPKVTGFIESINGTMLPKPFHIADLLDIISFVEVKNALGCRE